MSAWDEEIFSVEANVDFLDELDSLDEDEVEQAVIDAALLAANQDPDSVSEEELLNGRAAATIVAIWAGAPFSAGEVADTYPFIRNRPATVSDEAVEAATAVLEGVGEDEAGASLDQFLEALA